jgi:hypothetical protein
VLGLLMRLFRLFCSIILTVFSIIVLLIIFSLVIF